MTGVEVARSNNGGGGGVEVARSNMRLWEIEAMMEQARGDGRASYER